MALQTLQVKLTGVSPMIQHSGRFVDPNYWATKEIKNLTSKRSKTEADQKEIARLEFLGALYLDKQHRVIIPDTVLEASFINGAKKMKMGPQCKAGLIVPEHALLDYGEQLTPEELYAKEEYRLFVPVRVQQAKNMRMRPIFENWAAEVKVQYLDEVLGKSSVLDIIRHAGTLVGIGDWRPKYGRFTVEEME